MNFKKELMNVQMYLLSRDSKYATSATSLHNALRHGSSRIVVELWS